jgi:hypothetical protein
MSNMVTIPREVLEKLQWQEHEDRSETCCICHMLKPIIGVGHKQDCPIGIALKAANVDEKVTPQHEMEVVEVAQKYVTKLGIAKDDCRGCVFLKELRCEFPHGNSHYNDCTSGANHDGLNRVWAKVQ